MKDLFLQMLNMSLTASLFVLAVIVFRLIFRKAPKWLLAAVWVLPAIRLILPFSVKSVFSLLPSARPVESVSSGSGIPGIHTGLPGGSVVTGNFTETAAPVITEAGRRTDILSICAYLWVAGIALMLLYALVSYVRLAVKVREAVKYEKNVYFCDRVASPFILGFFKPKIYLPSAIQPADISPVLSHERAHLKRRDHLIKPLAFLLLSVYWFNPVLWAAFILLSRDIEYACDEKVLEEAGETIKKQYSSALINLSVPGRAVAVCPLAFGEANVRGRVKAVLSFKKPAVWIIIAALLASIVLSVCFLTDPAGVPVNRVKRQNEEAADLRESLENVEHIVLYQNGESRSVRSRSQLERIVSALKTVRVSRYPLSQTQSSGEFRREILVNDRYYFSFDENFDRLMVSDVGAPNTSRLPSAYRVIKTGDLRAVFDLMSGAPATGLTELSVKKVSLAALTEGLALLPGFEKNSPLPLVKIDTPALLRAFTAAASLVLALGENDRYQAEFIADFDELFFESHSLLMIYADFTDIAGTTAGNEGDKYIFSVEESGTPSSGDESGVLYAVSLSNAEAEKYQTFIAQCVGRYPLEEKIKELKKLLAEAEESLSQLQQREADAADDDALSEILQEKEALNQRISQIRAEIAKVPYPYYYNLDTTDGLVIYYWNFSSETRFGIYPGSSTSNRVSGATPSSGVSLEEMREILKTYEGKIEDKDIRVQGVYVTLSSCYVEYTEERNAAMRALLGLK